MSTSVWTSVAFPVLASLSGLLNTSSRHCICSTQTSGPVEAMSLGRWLRWNMGWGAALASGQASRFLSSLHTPGQRGLHLERGDLPGGGGCVPFTLDLTSADT